MTLTRVRESRDPNATRIDWLGLVTFSAALFMLVLALVRGNDEGWGSTLIVEPVRRLRGPARPPSRPIERRVAEPMLPLGLFRGRAFTGVQLAAFAVSASMFALFLYLTLYLQNYLGYSPLQAGLRYLPITLATFFVAPARGRAARPRPRPRADVAGAAGDRRGPAADEQPDASDGWTALLPGFLVAGAGVGLLNPVIADVALSVVPKEQSGMASGINDTFRQVGVAVGVAAWGAIFLAQRERQGLVGGRGHAAGRATGSARALVEAASGGQLHAARALAARGPAAARRNGHAAGFPRRAQRDPADRRRRRAGRRGRCRCYWSASARSQRDVLEEPLPEETLELTPA